MGSAEGLQSWEKLVRVPLVTLEPELGFEVGEFGTKGGEFKLDAVFPVGVNGRCGRWDDGRGGGNTRGAGCKRIDWPAEEMGIGGDATSMAGGQADDEGAFGVVLQSVELGLDAGQIREGVEPLAALAEFTCCLMTAQEKGAEKGDRGWREVVDFGVKVVPVFRDAGASLTELKGPLGFSKSVKCADDGCFVEMGDRVAIGGLVAGGDESVEGQRVGVWDENFFFEEATQDTGLFKGERSHAGEMICKGAG
jgi:hypothetical protein